MKIGIVSPSQEEFAPILRFLDNVKTYQCKKFCIYEGEFGQISITAIICGICKVNAAAATQLLVDKFAPDKILLFGVCGAIDDCLNIGDAIICQNLCHHDVDGKLLTMGEPDFPSEIFKADEYLFNVSKVALKKSCFNFALYFGLCVTGEAFVEDDFREDIQNKFHPLGVDMESAAVAQVCFLNEIPFLAVRTVTDTPKQRGLSVFHDNLLVASENAGKICKLILSRLISAD